MRSAWLSAIVVALSLLALSLQYGVLHRTGYLLGDFRAFYCASRLVVERQDPYLRLPLHACEVRFLGTTKFFRENPNLTIPAPLPGYALAALIPVAVLPYRIAGALWSLLLLASCVAAIVTLSRYARLPWQVTLAALSLSLLALSLPFGEVVPIVVGCISLSAFFAWRGRPVAAAAFAAASLIEPHLGLPVCLALFVWIPSSRWTLLAGVAALSALSLLTLGVPENIEYLVGVLPAHALSEIMRDTQYSLSAVLYAFGLSARWSLIAGTLWYAAMVVAGVVTAGALSKRSGNPAFVACVPAAFAVFGGTFIHLPQMAAAIPAAVLALELNRGTKRLVPLVALLLLSVPWGWSVSVALLTSSIYPVAFLAWELSNHDRRIWLWCGIASATLSLALLHMPPVPRHRPAHDTSASIAIDGRLAEAGWIDFSRTLSSHDPAMWWYRIPTWTGLAGLLLVLGVEGGTFARRAGRGLQRSQPAT